MQRRSEQALLNRIINSGLEATRRLESFVSTISELVMSRALNFDLLVSGGNTGLVMTYITERIYHYLRAPAPPNLVLPIFRYSPGFRGNPDYLFDNFSLQEEVESRLISLRRLQDVLFVDDEIGHGITALTILRLLRRWHLHHHNLSEFNYYVVAEDQGFGTHPSLSDTSIHFLPYAIEIEGWNNVIACIIPREYEEPIQRVFPDEVLAFHQRMNILLGLPLKEFNNGKPRFGFELHAEVAKKVSGLEALQVGFKDFLERQIATCVNPVNDRFQAWIAAA